MERFNSWLTVVAVVLRLIALGAAAIAGAIAQDQGAVDVQDVPVLKELSSKLSVEREVSRLRQ